MHTLIMLISLLLMPILLPTAAPPRSSGGSETEPQSAQAARQLLAVRGTIMSIKTPVKGEFQLTVKPAKEFAEVIVLARQNDLVGSATRRANDAGIGGLFGGTGDNETITAAELSEGDIVSVIYDPQLQNRALEIYLH